MKLKLIIKLDKKIFFLRIKSYFYITSNVYLSGIVMKISKVLSCDANQIIYALFVYLSSSFETIIVCNFYRH
jgi:hypothetical protein